MKHIGCALLLLLVGCASVQPVKVIPAVSNFSFESFAGEWKEIARLPDVYETDLENVKFDYHAKGTRVELVKSGVRDGRVRSLTSVGPFEGERSVGAFRLGFLYDFAELHRVIWVSPKYDEAIVMGNDLSSLWILAREKELPKAELDKLVKMAQDWGFDTTKLEYTKQAK